MMEMSTEALHSIVYVPNFTCTVLIIIRVRIDLKLYAINSFKVRIRAEYKCFCMLLNDLLQNWPVTSVSTETWSSLTEYSEFHAPLQDVTQEKAHR